MHDAYSHMHDAYSLTCMTLTVTCMTLCALLQLREAFESMTSAWSGLFGSEREKERVRNKVLQDVLLVSFCRVAVRVCVCFVLQDVLLVSFCRVAVRVCVCFVVE